MPKYKKDLIPCLPSKPYYNGRGCEACVMPFYWNINKNACLECIGEMVFDLNSHKC